MRYIFAALTLTSIAGVAAATCRPVVRFHAPVVHAPVVVKKAIVVETVPLAVYQPLAVVGSVYGGVYVPPAVAPVAPAAPAPAAPTVTQNQSDLQLILTALQSLDSRLKAVETKVGASPTTPVPSPANPPASPTTPVKPPDPFAPKSAGGSAALTSPATTHPAVATFRRACVMCHESKVATEKGGGFTMFTGDNLDLSKADGLQIGRIATRSYSGSMPKKESGITLTDKEVGEIQDFVDQVKKAR